MDSRGPLSNHGAARRGGAAPFNEMARIVNELLLSARRKARLVTNRAQQIAESDRARWEQYQKDITAVEAVFYAGEENDPDRATS